MTELYPKFIEFKMPIIKSNATLFDEMVKLVIDCRNNCTNELKSKLVIKLIRLYPILKTFKSDDDNFWHLFEITLILTWMSEALIYLEGEFDTDNISTCILELTNM